VTKPKNIRRHIQGVPKDYLQVIKDSDGNERIELIPRPTPPEIVLQLRTYRTMLNFAFDIVKVGEVTIYRPATILPNGQLAIQQDGGFFTSEAEADAFQAKLYQQLLDFQEQRKAAEQIEAAKALWTPERARKGLIN
jgi:hypothetical protein